MSLLPDSYESYTTSRRRYLFRKETALTARGDPDSTVWRALRLAEPGTALPTTFPSRAVLLAGDVLAVEEVTGCSVPELVTIGLSTAQAERLILWIERLTMTVFQSGPRQGQSYDADDVTLRESAAMTSSTTGDWFELGDRGTLRLDLEIAAVSGTNPVLHIQIETARTTSGTARVVDAFALKTATGSERRAMSGCDRFVRYVATLSGTSPSFTFSLTGEAV